MKRLTKTRKRGVQIAKLRCRIVKRVEEETVRDTERERERRN